MNSSNYRFTLDLHSTQSQISLPVTVGDTARVFLISLSDGGLPYEIDLNSLVKISIRRPTGSHLEAFCAVLNKTTIKYDFEQNPNTAIIAGVHDCSITLYDSEGRELGTPRFTMVVSDRVLNRDDLNITDEDKTLVDAMISAEAARNEAETGRVNAEAARVTAEEGRVETLRQIREAIANGEFEPSYTSVLLRASAWKGDDDPYSQVVSIPEVTENSRVDLLPTVEQLAIFHDKDLAFVTENVDGVVTVYAIGDKPTQDYTMEVCITEVKICQE